MTRNRDLEIIETRRGQGLLEFALILPLLFVVVFGVFDLGRLYFSTITLTSAAREGARFLSVFPDDISSTIPFSNTISVVIQEAENSGITLIADDVDPTCPNTDFDEVCDTGGTAVVTVTYDFELILGWLLPSPITITRAAQMVVP
jgi:hypothetical protein